MADALTLRGIQTTLVEYFPYVLNTVHAFFGRQVEEELKSHGLKVFDLAISRTGLREEEARQAGYEPMTVSFETWDHKVYYPGAQPIKIRVTADVNTKVILGAQIIGHYRGEVAKHIDIFAAAIFHRMTVEQLNDLDLSYTPPLSSPWDPVQMAVPAWSKQLNKTT
jgi:NADPH-dependent 2,4-dienoyl-CoA reductase/sulfur reductase-like enzyme